MRVLFILKKQYFYGGGYTHTPSSGLFASATMVADMLHQHLGIHTKLVLVTDNNGIDREVARYRPDVVIVEAVWVVPEKFRELARLHPHVKWVVRNHSAFPFLAQEGMAMKWLLKYPSEPRVFVGSNDLEVSRDLSRLYQHRSAASLYLPNYYPPTLHRPLPVHDHIFRVGCFGATRPLKNQLIQAVAAINYANENDLMMEFHVNGVRHEAGGQPVAKNIMALFEHSRHKLVTHPWLNRREFIQVLRMMDVSLQCSYSETFNMVSADAVMHGVPVVVSPSISWVDPRFQVNPNSTHAIMFGIGRALRKTGRISVKRLRAFDEESIRQWSETLRHIVERR